MALPFLRQAGEPPRRCSEVSWSPALLRGKLLSSGPNGHKESWSVAPEWKIKCVETLCSPLGISTMGRAGPPARHWLSANCGKDSRDGRAQCLDLLSVDACCHPVHTWETTASLPWSSERASGSAGCSTTGAHSLHTSHGGDPQGTHRPACATFLQPRDDCLL